MSEQIPNTKCRICGKIYYSCKTCSEIGHWKSVACCPEHFVKYVELVNNERNKNEENIVEIIIDDKSTTTNDEVVDVDVTNKRSKISEKSS